MDLPIYFEKESLKNKVLHSKIVHYHDNIELIYVLKGTMDCQTCDKKFLLSKGDLCFINRNQLHNLYENNHEDNEHLSLIIGSELFVNILRFFFVLFVLIHVHPIYKKNSLYLYFLFN